MDQRAELGQRDAGPVKGLDDADPLDVGRPVRRFGGRLEDAELGQLADLPHGGAGTFGQLPLGQLVHGALLQLAPVSAAGSQVGWASTRPARASSAIPATGASRRPCRPVFS